MVTDDIKHSVVTKCKDKIMHKRSKKLLEQIEYSMVFRKPLPRQLRMNIFLKSEKEGDTLL